MQDRAFRLRQIKPALALAASAVAMFADGAPARAASGANYILYNHHTMDAGEKEISVFLDVSNAAPETDYVASLLELEYGVTDRWTSALYFEGVKTEGEDAEFGGWRWENRIRLFESGTVPLNPTLYVEYENLRAGHRYLTVVAGRTDGEEEEDEEGTEHEIENRLILAQDIGEKLDVAFNMVAEVNLDTGLWSFGYAAGANYEIFDNDDAKGCDIKEIKLGFELYGGLGDNELGLTLDGSVTQQYLGLNTKAELANGWELGAGIAIGLTGDSEDALLRTVASYEFQ